MKLNLRHLVALPTIFCITFLLTACTTTSPRHFYQTAAKLNLQKNIIHGKQFPMIYYAKETTKHTEDLHIYLGGDGTPWLDVMTYSSDPSPSNPLMLQLMQMDGTQSLYLGRPCYQGLFSTPPCDYFYWTAGRYSRVIVENMHDAITQLIEQRGVKRLTLIGFSGGGALATLLARKIPQTVAVVTIAGLLDTQAWTDLHFYSPLNGSLNPAMQPPLAKHIRQIHLLGANDKNIPPRIVERFFLQQYKVEKLLFKQADHSCCWEKHWPTALKKLKNNPQKH